MNTPYSHEELSAVWFKAQPISSQDPNVFRLDDNKNVIQWSAYGNRDHQYGWEVDHIMPVSRGGSNALFNLRPLHWKDNVQKSDGLPVQKRTLFSSR